MIEMKYQLNMENRGSFICLTYHYQIFVNFGHMKYPRLTEHLVFPLDSGFLLYLPVIKHGNVTFHMHGPFSIAVFDYPRANSRYIHLFHDYLIRVCQ